MVHESHGLGIYRGIEKIEVDKTEKDYIKIEYAAGAISTFWRRSWSRSRNMRARGRKSRSKSSLRTEWNKTKSRVRGAVKEIAEDLVKLYACAE